MFQIGIEADADDGEPADARERRKRADSEWKINRRRPVIGGVIPLSAALRHRLDRDRSAVLCIEGYPTCPQQRHADQRYCFGLKR